MYQPICPRCRSRNIIRHGSGRWICKETYCRKSFQIKRNRRDRVAIEAYVEDRTTYERLGTKWGVHRSTAYRRVQRALKKRYALLDRTRRNLSLCDGVCVLDGKTVRIGKVQHTIFVAWDRGFKKPIHFLVKEGGEKELWYWKMLLDLKNVGYVPKAFVSDGIMTLKEFLEDSYPEIPHQRCAVHVFLAARSKVMPRRGTPNGRQREFIESLRGILWAQDIQTARRRWARLSKAKGLSRKERVAIELVRLALPSCFACKNPRWKDLNLPRSSNAIENVMGQIEVRLKTRRGAKSLVALERLVNELLLRVSKQTITHN